MPILIDAKKLSREIKALCNPYGKPSIGFEDGKKVLDVIARQETLNVKLLRHGYWDESRCYAFECSVCGNLCTFSCDFCPNCGAKMDKEVTK